LSSPHVAAALAALLLLAAASGWFLLNGCIEKPAEAAHLSIVVLPFKNLSGDPGQDYFADGITDNRRPIFGCCSRRNSLQEINRLHLSDLTRT